MIISDTSCHLLVYKIGKIEILKSSLLGVIIRAKQKGYLNLENNLQKINQFRISDEYKKKILKISDEL